MRTRWWQSIRWRLALGSMLVALLATVLLASIILIIINVSYGGDQRQQLINLASSTAGVVGRNYAHTNNLLLAAQEAVPGLSTQRATGEEYLQLVYNTHSPSQLIYPRGGKSKPLTTQFAVALTVPSVQSGDFVKIALAIRQAHSGITTTDEIGAHGPASPGRPFVVEPIFDDAQSSNPVVGILLVIPRSAIDNTTPPFLATVQVAVILVALVVAALAGLAAILFSRTITRPLAKLTLASRVLAAGNYSARARTDAQGELGELASSFNEMAARLEQDVDELRQQELRRRELIMNITHDLATPLTAIAGLGEALVDGISQNREDFQETGRVIVRETLRLRRLVKDLHMMAKAEAGAMQPQRRAVRLAPLVDEVFVALISEFERVNVEPRNNLPYNLPTVWADPDMLTRVFDNLCSNALRYTPSGGYVSVDAMQQGSFVQISVTDSGKGIPTSALPRIFDRFYRADPARQATTGGSGLGLAIVRAIVEAHGGRVWAENAQGAGARINFTLPLASANWEQLAGESTLPLGLKPRPGGQAMPPGSTQPSPTKVPQSTSQPLSPQAGASQASRGLPEYEPTWPIGKQPPTQNS
jgi:signal transduction histidine kinase